MSKHSFDTIVAICIEGGEDHRFETTIDYTYHKAVPAHTPRGECAPIDPPEPAAAEITAARWREEGSQGSFYQVPGEIMVLLDNDRALEGVLISDAEEGEYWARADYEYDPADGEPF